MQICIISDDYLPESIKSAGRMMHELAVGFQESGHEVFVLAPRVGTGPRWSEEVYEGVRVFRFRSGRIKNVAKPIRAINEMLLSWRAWRAGRRTLKAQSCDVIVYYSPTIFFGPLVRRLKRIWGSQSFLILRDIFPQWVVDQGMVSARSPIIKLFRIFERINYKAANVIGLQSPANQEYFRRYFPAAARTAVLYNWASVNSVSGKGKWRKALGLEAKTVFFFGGNLGHAQDMGQILRLAEKMRDDAAHFLFVGAGDEVHLIEQYIDKASPRNATYLPAVPQSDFLEIMAECDVGLFSLHRGHTTHNFPGKVLAYLAQGLPVLGVVNRGNDLQDVILSADAGFVCECEDEDRLLKSAQSLLQPSKRQAMGKNARSLLESKFSVSAATSGILQSLDSRKVGHQAVTGRRNANDKAGGPESDSPGKGAL